jgi:hypothetical protein
MLQVGISQPHGAADLYDAHCCLSMGRLNVRCAIIPRPCATTKILRTQGDLLKPVTS